MIRTLNHEFLLRTKNVLIDHYKLILTNKTFFCQNIFKEKHFPEFICI